MVGVGLLVKSHGQVVGTEREHVLIKHEVVDWVREPLVVALSTKVENLHVELGSGVDSAVGQVISAKCTKYLP